MCLKLFHSLELLAPNRYVMDISNEVLNIGFGQGAAKKLEVKVGGQKEYLPTQLAPGGSVQTGQVG